MSHGSREQLSLGWAPAGCGGEGLPVAWRDRLGWETWPWAARVGALAQGC